MNAPRRVAVCIAALVLGGQLTGCIALRVASKDLGEPMGTDERQLKPEEPDARLSCDAAPCEAAPIMRERTRGRSFPVFLGVTALEAGASYGLLYAAGRTFDPDRSGAGAFVGGVALLGAGLFFAADVLANGIGGIVVHREFGDQTSPYRMKAAVEASLEGSHGTVRIEDLVLEREGVLVVPATFSVRKLLGREQTSPH